MKEVEADVCFRLLHPKLIALVTSCDKKGKPNVMTVAWITPAQDEPPVVAFSVGKDSLTYRNLLETKEFVVNIPSIGMLSAVWVCGTKSGKKVDKFRASGLKASKSKSVRPPRVEGCVAYLECRLLKRIELEESALILGKVLRAEVSEELFDAKKSIYDAKKFKPILHLGGRYFTTTSGILRRA